MKNIITNITRVQWLTIGSIILYLFWEYYFVAIWESESEVPLIRVDLPIIYSVILIEIMVSLVQLFKQIRN